MFNGYSQSLHQGLPVTELLLGPRHYLGASQVKPRLMVTNPVMKLDYDSRLFVEEMEAKLES